MTPTATYLAEENCLQEEPTMEKPVEPHRYHYDLISLGGLLYDSNVKNYRLRLDEYNAHLATLRKIPCDPSCKGLWADGQKVVEGKDYKLKFQFLFSKEPEKWITCDQPFYRNMDVPERPIAFPLVPAGEDELWLQAIHYLRNNPALSDNTKVADLKTMFTINKR